MSVSPAARSPLYTMSLNLTQMAHDLRIMQSDIPQLITLANAQIVSAVVTEGPESDGLELGGVTEKARITVTLIVADCTTRPVSNDVIVYGGNNYRVESATLSDDGVSIIVQASGEFE